MKRTIYLTSLIAAFTLLCSTPNATALDNEAKAGAKADAKAHASVRLNGPSLQTVRERLFGTPDSGLLDGKGSFEFRAEDMVMTSAEAATFFNSTGAEQNLEALVRGAEALHGVVRIDGTIDGEPFELKISGHQLKLEGLTLTAEQRASLAAQLSGIEGLKEAKITATVDGKETVTKMQGGRVKLEVAGSSNSKAGAGGIGAETSAAAKARVNGPARIDADERLNGAARLDRPGRIEAMGRSDMSGRMGIERVVPGLGRR